MSRATMPLTRDFKETVRARAERDPAFRVALLVEVTKLLHAGELDAGEAILRDYIYATVRTRLQSPAKM